MWEMCRNFKSCNAQLLVMIFQKRITKDEIRSLPLLRYEGEVVIVRDEVELDNALDDLRTQSLLGFDTEARPSFSRYRQYPLALLQLATQERVYLIQLQKTGFPSVLSAIFEDRSVLKVGISIRDDVKKLQGMRGFAPNSVAELNRLASVLGIEHEGVRNLAGIFLHGRISKGQQTTNWAKSELTQKQIRYAATDAWVCLEIYNKIAAQGLIPEVTKGYYI